MIVACFNSSKGINFFATLAWLARVALIAFQKVILLRFFQGFFGLTGHVVADRSRLWLPSPTTADKGFLSDRYPLYAFLILPRPLSRALPDSSAGHGQRVLLILNLAIFAENGCHPVRTVQRAR